MDITIPLAVQMGDVACTVPFSWQPFAEKPSVPLDVNDSVSVPVVFVTYMQPDLSLCLNAISNSLLASIALNYI